MRDELQVKAIQVTPQDGLCPNLGHLPKATPLWRRLTRAGCIWPNRLAEPHVLPYCYRNFINYPFAEAIRNGFKGMIMSAHIMNRRLDDTYPASLSKKVVTGLLRQELGWNGVVVSDDLQMGAIRKYHSLEDTMRLAIEAGVDILLIGNNLQYSPDAHATAFAVLSHLVNSGQVSRERIAQSYRRIKTLFDSMR